MGTNYLCGLEESILTSMSLNLNEDVVSLYIYVYQVLVQSDRNYNFYEVFNVL